MTASFRSSPLAPDSPGTARPGLGEVEFIAMMAMMQALQAMAIDVMLPALGVISQSLEVDDPNRRQLIVSLYLLCAGFGAILPGPLADRFGRRRVLLGAMLCYFVLATTCALVHSFEMLLLARGLQGMTTAALMVMPMAIIRDRFAGDRMASVQSLVAVVFMTVPMVAPMIGQSIMLVAGWRWIFGTTAVASAGIALWAFLRLPETLHPARRQEIRLKVLVENGREVLTTRAAIGYVLGSALIQATITGYISSAQQLIEEHFGAGLMFPAIFGTVALLMAMANFVNSRIVQTFGARRVSQGALIGYVAISAIHVGLIAAGEGLWTFTVMMALSMCMVAFILANFQSIALQPFARIAGSAASVMAFLRMTGGSALGGLIGQAYDGSARPLVASMVLAGSGALVLVLYSERWRPFRRLHYPDAR